MKVLVTRRVGHFVPATTPLFMVYKGDRLTAENREELLSTVDIGPARTLQQDIEFGVLQIVDIALKAISPAVNDPSTGVTCVDQLSRILIRFASRKPPASVMYDPPTVARVSVSWIDFSKLLTSAFEQIRLYSTGDVAVSLRMLRALTDIAVTTSDQAWRRMLVSAGVRIVEGCAARLTAEELGPLRARLAALEKFAG